MSTSSGPAAAAAVQLECADVPLRRANGKRSRRKFDPNNWANSIPTQRTNVLCLGVSYPFVKHQLVAEKIDSKVLFYSDPGVDQTVELVQRKILTEMDGRDLVRCLALEDGNDTFAYCVSLETGARYGPRHLHANFNRVKFISQMKKVWGKVKFRQIILDYYWIPRGTWVMSHWSRPFFDTILPSFVTENMLDYSNGEANTRKVNSHLLKHSTSGRGGGVVYLPFCYHCVREVTAAIEVLSKYYCISFVYKSELSEHALWAATNSIDPWVMQTRFGKAIDQEETYCTFSPQEHYSAAEASHISKSEVLKVLRGIEDFEEVRMIKLTALKMYDPEYRGSKKDKIIGIDVGGFVDLMDPKEVKRGFDHVGKPTKVASIPVEENISVTLPPPTESVVDGAKKKTSKRPMKKRKALAEETAVDEISDHSSPVTEFAVADDAVKQSKKKAKTTRKKTSAKAKAEATTRIATTSKKILKQHESTWSNRIKALKSYRATNGNCRVPSIYKADVPLGKWVSKQKCGMKARNEDSNPSLWLTDERVAQLNDLGFWSDFDIDVNTEELAHTAALTMAEQPIHNDVTPNGAKGRKKKKKSADGVEKSRKAQTSMSGRNAKSDDIDIADCTTITPLPSTKPKTKRKRGRKNTKKSTKITLQPPAELSAVTPSPAATSDVEIAVVEELSSLSGTAIVDTSLATPEFIIPNKNIHERFTGQSATVASAQHLAKPYVATPYTLQPQGAFSYFGHTIGTLHSVLVPRSDPRKVNGSFGLQLENKTVEGPSNVVVSRDYASPGIADIKKNDVVLGVNGVWVKEWPIAIKEIKDTPTGHPLSLCLLRLFEDPGSRRSSISSAVNEFSAASSILDTSSETVYDKSESPPLLKSTDVSEDDTSTCASDIPSPDIRNKNRALSSKLPIKGGDSEGSSCKVGGITPSTSRRKSRSAGKNKKDMGVNPCGITGSLLEKLPSPAVVSTLEKLGGDPSVYSAGPKSKPKRSRSKSTGRPSSYRNGNDLPNVHDSMAGPDITPSPRIPPKKRRFGSDGKQTPVASFSQYQAQRAQVGSLDLASPFTGNGIKQAAQAVMSSPCLNILSSSHFPVSPVVPTAGTAGNRTFNRTKKIPGVTQPHLRYR